jgi:hypothetical protein
VILASSDDARPANRGLTWCHLLTGVQRAQAALATRSRTFFVRHLGGRAVEADRTGSDPPNQVARPSSCMLRITATPTYPALARSRASGRSRARGSAWPRGTGRSASSQARSTRAPASNAPTGSSKRFLSAGIGVPSTCIQPSAPDAEGGHTARTRCCTATPTSLRSSRSTTSPRSRRWGRPANTAAPSAAISRSSATTTSPPASWLPVPMSSIHSPMVEMGRGGSQVLHDIIAGGHPEPCSSSPPSAPATRPSTSRSEPNHRRDSSERTNEIGSA